MAFINLAELTEKEIIPGYHARFVHSENMTFAYWRIDGGALMPTHSHPQEQVFNITEGEFELTVANESKKLKPGQVAVIPGNVPHSGKAISNCKIIDVFYPVRPEYK